MKPEQAAEPDETLMSTSDPLLQPPPLVGNLRDAFAAAALTGLLADHTYEDGPADAAKRAYDYAAAMLAERRVRQ
jgi:hypothetical protein